MMEEDQEARRARLKAMREQAQQISAPTLPTMRLTNPFEDPFPTSDAQTPRFNYYSDPLAGFTNPKRKDRGTVGHPSHPQQQAVAGGSSTWQPDFHPSAGPPPPYSPQTGGFGSPIPSYDPYQQGFGPLPPAPGPQARWHSEKQQQGSGRGGIGYAGNSRPDSGQRGPGRWEGRGPWRSDGSRSGGRGGGGRGPKLQRTGESGPGISARDRPDLFYNKCMVEDPWRNLR